MATAKQIAARAKFAAMARSGAFKRKPGAKKNPIDESDVQSVAAARARIKELDALVLKAIDARNWTTADRLDRERGKLWKFVDVREGRKPRSNNPIPPKRGDSDEYFIEVEGGGWLVDYKTHSRPINWTYSRAFSGAQSFNVAQAARVKSVCDEYGLKCAVMPVTENPAKRKGVTRPSQATGKAPTKRLVQRRKKTAKAPPGYFANPVDFEGRSGTAGVKMTAAVIEDKAAQLGKLLGAPAWSHGAVGAIGIDRGNGGYMLVQMRSAAGAESDLSDRLNAREMVSFLDGALLVARAKRS